MIPFISLAGGRSQTREAFRDATFEMLKGLGPPVGTGVKGEGRMDHSSEENYYHNYILVYLYTNI